MACVREGAEGGRVAAVGAGVLLILVSGSLWVLNQIDWRAERTDFDREGEGSRLGIDRGSLALVAADPVSV